MMARALVLIAALLAPLAAAAGGPEAAKTVSVRETGAGVYTVTARFDVPQPAAVVHDVLTDYASIPRYLPDVRRSVAVATADGRVRVEQEAVSRFLFFSKKVHLVLDVREEADTIRFSDACGRSFHRYEGAWTLTPADGGTTLVYELTAQPAFAVPDALVARVLGRDADEMIRNLRAEFARRASHAAAPPTR